jgi:hypothetical protein
MALPDCVDPSAAFDPRNPAPGERDCGRIDGTPLG